jgi:two-component system chemotaxis response regulator CheB
MMRVLLVDDSAVVRAVLKDIFRTTSDITVVAEAANGSEAVALTERLKPDLIIMDIMMPVMDGLAAIEIIMAQTPTPILVLSATMDDREVNYAFSAIKKGALDVMEKPGIQGLELSGTFGARLIEKARMLARIKAIRRRPSHKLRPEKAEMQVAYPKGERSILAIGASTGGPKAVMSIIKSLSADFAGVVFIVQHIASGFAKGFAQWLDQECVIRVSLAVDGQKLQAGEVLVAPNDCHMIVDKGKVRLVQGEPVNCCRPSIDVFFNSLAEEGSRVVGVLLTGMGKDGAQGLYRIKEQGGVTIAQDELSCAVFGMPRAAIAINAADEILPLPDIPDAILKIFTR